MSRLNRYNTLRTNDTPHVSFRPRRSKGSLFACAGVLKPASHNLVYTERKKDSGIDR
jgi:hypothetical protein